VSHQRLLYLPYEITTEELVNPSMAMGIEFTLAEILQGKLMGKVGEFGPLLAQVPFQDGHKNIQTSSPKDSPCKPLYDTDMLPETIVKPSM